MINPVWNGIIKAGKFIPNEPAFKKFLQSIEEKQVSVVFKQFKKRRSNNQNKFYWGVVIPIISQETGYTHDESHDAMRLLFLAKRECAVPTVKSTRDLSTVEFEEYIENIRRFAASELGASIPEPNEVEC